MKKVLNTIIVGLLCMILLVGCGKGIGPEGISKDEYDKIEIGMYAREAEEIIGGEMTKISQSQDDTGNFTDVYEISGEQGGTAQFTFKTDFENFDWEGQLIKKEQKDLK